MFNIALGYALRGDAIARDRVEGTSLPGPSPVGRVRDIIEVLLSTAMQRPTAHGPGCRARAGTAP